MNTCLPGEETHSLDGNADANSAAATSILPITSQDVPRQIRAATDPLTKQLEKLCDLTKELHRDTARRNDGTSAQIQNHSGSRGEKYDSVPCHISSYWTEAKQRLNVLNDKAVKFLRN